MVIGNHFYNNFIGPCSLYVCWSYEEKITVLFQCPKDKMWFSHFRHHFKITVLYPFSFKVILLNQVSGFIGKLSNLEYDIISYRDG